MSARIDVDAPRSADPSQTALAALYDRISARGATVLVTGDVTPDPPPIDGADRWGISAVLRPLAWSAALTRAADSLARLLGPSHVVYRPDALHVTLRQFEGHRAQVGVDDRNVRAYVSVLESFAAATPTVSIDLRGLVASSTGIVVKGWPRIDLRALRLDLHERLDAACVPMVGPEHDRSTLRDSAHASLAIFGGPIERPAALAAFVATHADADFGTCVFDDVWLVGYRRTRASISLIEYGRFAWASGSTA